MAEKYNLKDELLSADERLVGSNSLLGMTMLTQPQYNNSMRSVMFTSHLKQFVNLENPDFPGFFTNGENLVGKHSSGYKKAKGDLKIIRKVEKYADIVDKPFVYTLFVYNQKKNEYDIITRQDSENLTEVFGYTYNNETIDSYEEGDTIKKGTVIYKSKSYDDAMNYGYGKNVPIMYTTEPFTSEDAAVVAKSLVDEVSSIEISTVAIGVNQNDVLLNIYGDDYIYKVFPDLGEYTKGEVAFKRTLFTNQLLTDFSDSALKRPEDSDTAYYYNGRVLDITIYNNNPDLPRNEFNEQIWKYLDSQTAYYEEIKEVCEEIFETGAKFSHNLDYLYKRACEFLDPDKGWKDNNSVFGNLRIEITLKKIVPLNAGQKLTGRYGNKSVIAVIRDDDDMPFYYNDRGEKVVVKLLFNILAIINRTTAFPMYEISINYVCNKVRDRMWLSNSLDEREKLLFGIIHDFNEKQSREMKSVYDKLTLEEKEEYIQDVLNERIFIHQQPMNETKPIFFRFLDIYNKYDFLKPYDIFINKWGRTIKCLNPAYIGEMYILKLKQTSRKGFSARSTGSINSKGLPERSYKNKSFTELRSSTPIRFGEFETLNFSIACMPEDMEMFHLMYRTSSKARRELASHILSPNNDEFEISSSYTSRTAEIFAVVLKSLGLRIDFVDEDEEIREYDDSKVKEFVDDEGRSYLCTEYQYMLVKRKQDIEKEILKQHGGVMDIDELEDKVMNELYNRKYLIGPDKEDYPNIPAFWRDTAI